METAPTICPRCGTALLRDAPQGLCPACLFLEGICQTAPAELRPGTVESSSSEKPGDSIGRYRLREQIGEGGFGVVYLAEQTEPVQRKVALKIIKAGMDSKEVVARFEAERQALALMDHPNIAKVFDGGVTQTGRPYFVMELVRGIPFTRYCDRACLDTVSRLRLFIQVCKAVQHAHQKGIIHRDLKPSNILVTHHESEPLPKVIDFGVAKALGDQKLTDKTFFTGFLRLVGTPAYMSPEQAELTGMDIDTRSDIYALGVLLYELLTGMTPFDAETLRHAALDEMRRIIRETEPPKPSTRVESLGDRLTEVAKQRHIEPPKLVHLLRGDLDWIVMKCLEKDRRRRYETANGLAMDVQRHLENEPVTAHAPSAGYRLQKLVRRNKLLCTAGAAVAVSILLGLAIATASLLREKTARREAVAARKTAEAATRDKQEQLWRSQLIEARYYRTSGQLGQRTRSLEVIGETANWRPSVELRNEAIAALLLPDLSTNVWFRDQANAGYDFACDGSFEHYVPYRRLGRIEVRRTRDDALVASFGEVSVEITWSQFSPDGRHLAVYFGSDGAGARASLWDWRIGRRISEVVNDLGPTSRPVFDFTPDGREFIVATRPGPVRRFDVENGRELQPPLLTVAAQALRLSPSGQSIAISRSGELQVWSLARRQQVARCVLPTSLEGLQDIAWHPHEELLAIGSGGGLCLWQVGAKDSELVSAPSRHITHVFFNPDGDLLLAGGWGNFCGIWDAATGRVLLSNRDGAPVQLSRDGRQLAYARERIGVGVRRLLHPSGLRRLLVPASQSGNYGALDATFHPSGHWLLSAHLQGWLLWDSVAARIVARHRGPRVNTARFLPDGRSFITCGPEGVRRWTFQIASSATRTGPAASRSSNDGESQSNPSEVLLPVAPEGENLLPSEPGPFERLALSPDGRRFAAVSAVSASLVCQVNGSNVVRLAGSRTRPGNYIYFSPDGRWVMTANHHGARFSVYDAASGQHVRELQTGGSWGFFRPDGHRMVSAGLRDYAIWQVGTWELVRRIPCDSLTVDGSGFSPDGRYYLINDSETHLRFRDAATYRDFATLVFPNTAIWGSGFDPGGRRLVTTSSLTAVSLWDLAELRRELARLGLDWPDEHPGQGFVPRPGTTVVQ